jgi:hypothetical protein
MTFRKRVGPMKRRISQAQATTFFVDNRTSTKLDSVERSVLWTLQHPRQLTRRLTCHQSCPHSAMSQETDAEHWQ